MMNLIKLRAAGAIVLMLGTGLGMAAESAKNIKADNTAVNKVDGQRETLTPEDQVRGSDADVELTRKIREALTAQDGLSTDAKNIKIITLKGVVTLRGPVDTKAELSKVENLVKLTVGSKHKINSDLSVKNL